ncbi:hypothetical protein ACQ3I4_04505 [Zafaria sp. Z1313]|uniref:hypothetical protein n=1 Tax=unclassified Zafaria TaxID=2828765 RepID=UPI002E77C488|nr:hypothetical protein [Zafaria sp. J156]MEE1620695.1 hypothetical protein [Zafaria sp. J156]
MAQLQGLDSFLGSRWRHRAHAAVLLRRADGAVLVVRAVGTDAGVPWILPASPVRSGATPRGTAGRVLSRLALEPEPGRLLVHEFIGGPASEAGGAEHLVYDAGTWLTDVDGFTADGGRLDVRFLAPDALSPSVPRPEVTRILAALDALELGGVAELEDGRDVTPREAPGNGAPARSLMPELPAGAPVPGLRRRATVRT